jgi:hypothetical protein
MIVGNLPLIDAERHRIGRDLHLTGRLSQQTAAVMAEIPISVTAVTASPTSDRYAPDSLGHRLL